MTWLPSVKDSRPSCVVGTGSAATSVPAPEPSAARAMLQDTNRTSRTNTPRATEIFCCRFVLTPVTCGANNFAPLSRRIHIQGLGSPLAVGGNPTGTEPVFLYRKLALKKSDLQIDQAVYLLWGSREAGGT